MQDFRAKALRRAERYSWDAVASAYEQMLLEVCGESGHGPLPLDRLEELERATSAAL